MIPKNQQSREEETKLVFDKETASYKRVPISEAHKYGDGDQSTSATSESPLTPSELAALEGMDREGLVELIQRVYKAGWGFPGLTGSDLIKTVLMAKDEVYDALMVKGATLALNAKEWKEYKELATFWTERERGKPVGTASNIMIGGNGEARTIKVVFITPEEVRAQRDADMKVIEG